MRGLTVVAAYLRGALAAAAAAGQEWYDPPVAPFKVYTGHSDGVVYKTSESGGAVWASALHTGIAHAVATDGAGNVYSAGADDTVRKRDAAGAQVWSFTGHTGDVRDVAVDGSGHVYSASTDGTVRKISPEGVQVWSTAIGSIVYSVAVDRDGFVYCGSADTNVYKLDKNGNEVWVFTECEDLVYALAVDLDGFVYIASHLDSFIRKITAQGALVWKVGYAGAAALYSVVVDDAGFVYHNSGDDTRKLTPEGVEVWEAAGNTNTVYAVAVDPEGYVYSTNSSGRIYKFAPTGGAPIWTRVTTGFLESRAIAVDPGRHASGNGW